VQIALGSAVAVGLIGATAFSAVSWNYMQHDNGFCSGCHIMKQPFQKFTLSEQKHDTLECHACHQQSIFASMRQLYLWVAERPQEIGPHAKVPRERCEQCHVTGAGKEKWQDIVRTAGHRAHLESDSIPEQKRVCVTCHGWEVHRFVPVDSTCAQSDCHTDVKIKIGKMAGQTDLHCVTCHQFTKDVPKLATRDSATGALVPARQECLSCHQMREILVGFDPIRDPHSGTCGMCHNPHTQTSAQEAAKSCTSAQCHGDWKGVAFHTGATHRPYAEKCLTCHLPHAAKVDASDCEGCHRSVRERTRGRPPLPFDTTRTRRQSLNHPGPSGELLSQAGHALPVRPEALQATSPGLH